MEMSFISGSIVNQSKIGDGDGNFHFFFNFFFFFFSKDESFVIVYLLIYLFTSEIIVIE